jgi:hypothetical protein
MGLFLEFGLHGVIPRIFHDSVSPPTSFDQARPGSGKPFAWGCFADFSANRSGDDCMGLILKNSATPSRGDCMGLFLKN